MNLNKEVSYAMIGEDSSLEKMERIDGWPTLQKGTNKQSYVSAEYCKESPSPHRMCSHLVYPPLFSI